MTTKQLSALNIPIYLIKLKPYLKCHLGKLLAQLKGSKNISPKSILLFSHHYVFGLPKWQVDETGNTNKLLFPWYDHRHLRKID